MEAIIKEISEKYNVSPELTKTIVNAVVSQIKTKLPDSIAGQVDGFLAGNGSNSNAGNLGDLKDTFSKLF